jgi:hypothetical protein
MLHNWVDGACSRCGAFEPKISLDTDTQTYALPGRTSWWKPNLMPKPRPPGQTMLNFRLFFH